MKLDIDYCINKSLLTLLIEYGNHTEQEVWAHLQDLTHKCFNRLLESGSRSTWTHLLYPGTNIKMRFSVQRYCPGMSEDERKNPNITISGVVKIKLAPMSTRFSSADVEKFLIEKVLLGDQRCATE